ncbi:MAG: hypothetical protein K6B44_11560 [Lachnospiraceae bacterium]|nr:hypothetical protein [Lachnospiraceae bacterium]
MEIQIEKGSEAFFREFVSLQFQGRHLIKDPERKFKDMFKSSRNTLILCIILLIWQTAMLKFNGPKTFLYILIGCTVMLFIMIIFSFFIMNKNLKTFLAKNAPSTLSLSAEGIENTTNEGEKVAIPWSKIAYIRIFKEMMAFMPHDISGIIIGLDSKYAPQIMDWITQNNINIRFIAGEKK